MSDHEQRSGLDGELSGALDGLQRALHQAVEATGAIRALLPRVAAISSLFDEIDVAVRSGREQVVAPNLASPQTYTRPTLLVPSAAKAGPASSTDANAANPVDSTTPEDGWTADASFEGAIEQAEASARDEAPTPTRIRGNTAVTCFRLEFESRPGPLDLRVVDDAVGEHPAVRDVALLDYDGRKATLKVWIDATATPAEVQQALIDRAPQIFTPGNEVSIVALENAA